MTDETLRLFLAALGRALTEAFGEQPSQALAPLPAPVQEPQAAHPEPVPVKEKKPRRVREHTFTCVDCGKSFSMHAYKAKYCLECKDRRTKEKLTALKQWDARKKIAARGGDVNLWEGPSQDADMVYGNSIDM